MKKEIITLKATQDFKGTAIKAGNAVEIDTNIKTGAGYPCAVNYRGKSMLLAVKEQGAGYIVKDSNAREFAADKTELEIIGRATGTYSPTVEIIGKVVEI